MKVSCPYCGNDDDFYEVAEGVTITTFYVQNEDGSFSAVSDDSKIQGEVRLLLRRMPQGTQGIPRTFPGHAFLVSSFEFRVFSPNCPPSEQLICNYCL